MSEPSPSATTGVRAPELGVPRWVVGQAWAVALVAAAVAARLGLEQAAPGILPFATFFPAVLGASVLGGWGGGVTALVLSAIGGSYLAGASAAVSPTTPVNLALYLATCAVLVVVGGRLRGALERQRAAFARLQESELRYRTLFGSMSEGFDLCEAIRDEAGKVVDWRVIEINPALQSMIPTTGSVAGMKRSQFGPAVQPEWLASIDQALAFGEPIAFEFEGANSGHWFEVHLNRLSPDRFCQFFIDISERKRIQSFQAHLLGELNHRIKNSLQIVSALLRMQAGGLQDPAKDHLMKAVSRIQAISDIHGSLDPGSSHGDVDFDSYLRELCARLGESLLETGRIRLEVDASPARLGLDQAVPLGIVVNELVTNAAKYAYRAGEGGVISVSYRPAPGGGGVLVVADQGPGLSKGLDGTRSGLGLKVVRALATQLRGELALLDGPGAAFELRFGSALAPQQAA